ncbi:MAG: hypothetical protein SP1CHLAM54_15360 [Chlamydiia bacterium]|nr:hypothetical protein [Chlamydiia bacterium]MCH9616426.1 hypothetical protein [Chlamydiia bacterium]MCH9629588.1 hypothetical protein [Chlamydiia bacterium]
MLRSTFVIFSLYGALLYGQLRLPDWAIEQINEEISHAPSINAPFAEISNEYQKQKSKYAFNLNIVIIKNGVIHSNCAIKHSLSYLHSRYKLPDMIFYYFYGAGPTKFVYPKKGFDMPFFAGNKTKKMDSVILLFDRMSFHAITPSEHHQNYLLARTMGQVDNVSKWGEKKNLLFWRGQLTDLRYNPGLGLEEVKQSPRLIIAEYSKQRRDLINAMIYFLPQHSTYQTKRIIDRFQLQYTENFTSIKDHLAYKYQLCLDGLTCTNPGYAWRLKSGSCTFKQESENYQWFYRGLKPWVHYVPVKNNLEDIFTRIRWARDHDDQAHQIAKNAREFAQQNLTEEMFLLYTYTVLNKWASYQNLSTEDWDHAFHVLKHGG